MHNFYLCIMKTKCGFLLSCCLLWTVACTNDTPDYDFFRMKDSYTFHTKKGIALYDNPTSFLNIKKTVRRGSYDPNLRKRDSIYGYTEMKELSWERAKFGKWIEKYGLKSGEIYFVCTLGVTKRIPSSSEYYVIPGGYDDSSKDSIGISENSMETGFLASTTNIGGDYASRTIIKKIGYTASGEKVGIYYPISPALLKWRYFLVKDLW